VDTPTRDRQIRHATGKHQDQLTDSDDLLNTLGGSGLSHAPLVSKGTDTAMRWLSALQDVVDG
jgi:hypothetical protein